MDIRFDPFLSGKESQRTHARRAINGHLWLTLNTHVCYISIKRLSSLDSPAGMVDERWPGITSFGALVGDNHPLDLVDNHGLCKGRLSFTLRRRIRALLGLIIDRKMP